MINRILHTWLLHLIKLELNTSMYEQRFTASLEFLIASVPDRCILFTFTLISMTNTSACFVRNQIKFPFKRKACQVYEVKCHKWSLCCATNYNVLCLI